MVNTVNTTTFTTTTLAPGAVSIISEMNNPVRKQSTETIPEQITTERKLLHSLIDVRAGKIIRLEINNEPIIIIPSTIVIAVKTAISILYILIFMPVALEKLSSKVTANIL